jgi:hypothetical protein
MHSLSRIHTYSRLTRLNPFLTTLYHLLTTTNRRLTFTQLNTHCPSIANHRLLLRLIKYWEMDTAPLLS